MYDYFFQLGTTPKLCFAELACVLKQHKLESISPQIIRLQSPKRINAQKLQDLLGGCVKILKSRLSYENPTSQAIANFINSEIPTGRINFSYSEFNRLEGENLFTTDIKKELVKLGRSVRFIETNKNGVSAAILLHQKKIQEFVLISTAKKHYLAQTITVQNIDDWTLRDRGKPYADRKKGLLPPKVARMLLNINRSFDKSKQRVVLDPFCGSGNILLENAMLQEDGVGLDIDRNSISGTSDNLKWFSKTYQQPHKQQVFVADATHVPAEISEKVTAIVTEPFLGKPKPRPDRVANIFRGLEKLYLGACKNWRSFLPNGAPITIVFPHTTVGSKELNMHALIDKLLPLGYTTVSGPLDYGRSGAVVSRSIYTFILKK